jgi:hypothetical protein
VDLYFVSVVRNELQSRAIGIKDLAAARNEARAIGLGRSNRVGNTNESRFGIHVGEFPGDSPGLGIEG